MLTVAGKVRAAMHLHQPVTVIPALIGRKCGLEARPAANLPGGELPSALLVAAAACPLCKAGTWAITMRVTDAATRGTHA